MKRAPTLIARITLSALTAALISCNLASSPKSETGPEKDSDLPQCGELPYFTVIPLPVTGIEWTDVIGRLGPPEQTLPKRHPGIMLKERNQPVVSPGNIILKTIRRNRYVVSDWRQGEEDYSINFDVCEDVYGYLGHLGTLDSATFPTVEWDRCDTYSTWNETVEACEMLGKGRRIEAGQPLGTAGFPASDAVDFGLMDQRVHHVYAAPERFTGEFRHAVSQFEYYDSASQSVFFEHLYDPLGPESSPVDPRTGKQGLRSAAQDSPPHGEPRFGTMAVDVPGTAQGIWAEPGGDWSVVSEQHRFIVLANNPYRPTTELTLSLGPDALGAWGYRAPREATGRLNRVFADITPGSGIHCYFGAGLTGEGATREASWFVELPVEDSLRIERVTHAQDASPCLGDPSAWAFGAGAMTLVR